MAMLRTKKRNNINQTHLIRLDCTIKLTRFKKQRQQLNGKVRVAMGDGRYHYKEMLLSLHIKKERPETGAKVFATIR